MKTTTDTTALIVGGSTGIGKAVARKLLECGTAVLLVARDEKKLAAAKTELSAMGSVGTVSLDLYDERLSMHSSSKSRVTGGTSSTWSSRRATSSHCCFWTTQNATTTRT